LTVDQCDVVGRGERHIIGIRLCAGVWCVDPCWSRRKHHRWGKTGSVDQGYI